MDFLACELEFTVACFFQYCPHKMARKMEGKACRFRDSMSYLGSS